MSTALRPGLAAASLRSRLVRWIVAPLVGLAFLWYVYPTQYSYFGDYRSGLVRIHRVTQEAQLLTRTGWVPLQPPAPSGNPFDSLGMEARRLQSEYDARTARP